MDMYVCKYVFDYCIHSECVSITVLFSYHHFVYQDEKLYAVLSNKLFDLTLTWLDLVLYTIF